MPPDHVVCGVDLSWDAGTSYSSQKTNTFTNTGADVTKTYGSSTDTWGRTWTATELNNTNFRARLHKVSSQGFQAEMQVDHITVKVFWRPKIVITE